ncbi:MAG: EVE domain-containing protein [Anaerolineales bacterium]|nr:EVE domain-containing protein [Anaerolineales bacterium]
MGAHIFLVSENNFEICLRHGVYGCVLPRKEWNKAEIISGILSIETDDLIFFYVKNKGVYGLWKVIGYPYYDETKIWSGDDQLYPYRFSFKPTVNDFDKPISLSDILDLHDRGKIWTFDLNPVLQKNQYKITMDEASILLRLLLRNNPIQKPAISIPDAYIPDTPGKIEVDFSSCESGRFRYEGWLNAWFIHAFSMGTLKPLFGDYREYLNLVPTTFNKVMDLFLTHVTNIDGMDIVYKYTCIELKTERADEQDLAQVLRYEDWLTRKLAAGDREMVQSFLIANRFSDSLIEYVEKRNRIEEKVVHLISYTVTDKQSVDLEKAAS